MSFFYCSGSDQPSGVQNLPSGYYLLEGHFVSDFSDEAVYFPRLYLPVTFTKDKNQTAIFYYDQGTHFWSMTQLNYPCGDPKNPTHTSYVPSLPVYMSTDTYNSSKIAEFIIFTPVNTCYGDVAPQPLVLMSDGTLCEPGNPKNMIGVVAYTPGQLALNKDSGEYPMPAVTCVFWKAIPMNSRAPPVTGSYVIKVYLQPDLSDTPMYLGYNANDNTLQVTGTRRTLWYYDQSSVTLAAQPELRTTPQTQDAVWLQASAQGGVVTANASQNNALQFLFAGDKTLMAGLAFGPLGSLYSVNGQVQLPVLNDQRVLVISGIPIYVQAVPFSVTSNYEILKSLMVEVTDKTDPNYIACQGGPGAPDTQVCFLNHSKENPTVPALPQISYNPLEVFGYNRSAVGAPGASRFGAGDPMLYLTAPNDAMQLNQMQVSTCLQDDCSCHGQNPDACKADPSGYCKCPVSGHQINVCGFQCRPGLEAHRLSDCTYDPINDVYVTHYQCFPPVIVGTTDDKKVRGCCSYAGPAITQPNGPTFNTMQACFEKFVNQCPVGYEYHGNLDRPGCYRVRDWTTLQACSSTGHCSAPSDKCGVFDTTWNPTCSGSCDGVCECSCVDWSTVPPYGYYCDNGGHNDQYARPNQPKWIQNKSASPLTIPRGQVSFVFGHEGAYNYGVDSYCQVGVTGYGPDYIGPPGVPRCVNA